MKSFSVAEAKTGLPGLIDKVIGGEEVVITRHGRPVVEVRPALSRSRVTADRAANSRWLAAQRKARPSVTVDSLDVLRDMAEERPW